MFMSNIYIDNLDKASGIDKLSTITIISYLNKVMENRHAPLYIFFYPNIDDLANKLHIDSSQIFASLKYLSCQDSTNIKLKAILEVDEDELFYELQEEDFDELKTFNTIHNPYDPNIIYNDAAKLIRHAFVVTQ